MGTSHSNLTQTTFENQTFGTINGLGEIAKTAIPSKLLFSFLFSLSMTDLRSVKPNPRLDATSNAMLV